MRSVERVIAVEQNFTRSLDRLLTLGPRYVMVTYLTHRDGVEGRRVCGVKRKGWRIDEAKRLGKERVRTFRFYELVQRSLWFVRVWRLGIHHRIS